MGDVIISTFGGAPGGIIEGIKQFGCNKLILLLTDKPQSKKSEKSLNEIEEMAKQMKIPLSKVYVSPYDVMGNIQKIKKIISDNGDDVILNITGGRKTLSLSVALAGFVSNPKDIIYIQEENNEPISIPKFTLGDKLLRPEKMEILRSVKVNTTVKEIMKELGEDKKYFAILKHLRGLEETGLIIADGNSRERRYTITPSGELLG